RPATGDVWYLRRLLYHHAGRNFEQMRTISDATYNTYKDAAFAKGIVPDNKESLITLEEQESLLTGKQLRSLFATLCLEA
ncbi:hypothetical protein JKP88DRAFT_153107, partial [Tribonema minus]